VTISPRGPQIGLLDRNEGFSGPNRRNFRTKMKNTSNLPMLEVTTGKRTVKSGGPERIAFA
jgi:hypothetical protein